MWRLWKNFVIVLKNLYQILWKCSTNFAKILNFKGNFEKLLKKFITNFGKILNRFKKKILQENCENFLQVLWNFL